jgi:CheY-like chemotaxis protein
MDSLVAVATNEAWSGASAVSAARAVANPSTSKAQSLIAASDGKREAAAAQERTPFSIDLDSNEANSRLSRTRRPLSGYSNFISRVFPDGAALRPDGCSRRAGRVIDTVTLTGRYIRTVIVGDSADFVRAASASIENEPGLIVVATADNGFASLIVVDVLHPDLVVIDAAMPGTDGVEAARRIKARPEPPAVVLITRDGSAEIAQAAREAGADAVISKRELDESAECILRALGARPECSADAGPTRPSD